MKQLLKPSKITVLLLGIVILLLGVAMIATRSASGSAEPITAPTNNIPFTAPRSVKIEVDTQQSQKQPVNNFYKNPTITYPSGDTVMEETQQYQLAFVLKDKLFIISIYPSGTAETQTTAEKSLVTKLGISQETVCTLNVEVHSFLNASLSLPPKISKVSFCN